MEALIFLFKNNWQRKSVALLVAIILWLLVGHSITETKTLSSVPIRIVNLPSDKTIIGMKPNGILSKRINLTVSGAKRIIDALESDDVEILLDASTITHDDWIFQITKKNLISLNPNLDLSRHISNISYPELVIKLSKLITAKIPITIQRPHGKVPKGYLYLDIWPQTLTQTLIASEEELKNIPKSGLSLTFDMNQVSSLDLDKLKLTNKNTHDDEIYYNVPHQWKKITLPFPNSPVVELNDPDAQYLHIDFLRREYLPIGHELPVRLYYPQSSISVYQPRSLSIGEQSSISSKSDISYLALPLWVKDVSRTFLDLIKDRLEIVFVAEPEGGQLPWSLQIIDPNELEDQYVTRILGNAHNSQDREEHLRDRFQDFLKRLTLFSRPDYKLKLHAVIKDKNVIITPITAPE